MAEVLRHSTKVRGAPGCAAPGSRLAKGLSPAYVSRMTWSEVCEDKLLATLPYRMESDRWGNIVMSPLEFPQRVSIEG